MRKFLEEVKYDASFIKGHTLQPHWYKILKVFLIVGFLVVYFLFFGGIKLLIFCGVFFGLSLILHVLYRIKTEKFTKSWLDFIVEEVDGQLKYKRIGIYYYLMVAANLVLALIFSQIFRS